MPMGSTQLLRLRTERANWAGNFFGGLYGRAIGLDVWITCRSDSRGAAKDTNVLYYVCTFTGCICQRSRSLLIFIHIQAETATADPVPINTELRAPNKQIMKTLKLWTRGVGPHTNLLYSTQLSRCDLHVQHLLPPFPLHN